MLSRINVVMDRGGAISRTGSNKELFTKDFGGCTAIYAHTDSGLYGLYHLRSTFDREPDMVPDAKDSNQPYRKWIKELKEQSKDEMIHFQIGTPRSYGSRDTFMERHPELGMERYLRKLCKKYGIENYDITLMNFVDVDSVSITDEGIHYYYNGELVTEVGKAEYQTDEEILENSDWSNKKCLQFIKGDPNVDFDGKLLAKYEERYEKEQREAKQKEMEMLKNQNKEMVKALKEPMLITINNMIAKYQKQFESGSKGDHKAFNECCFLEELYSVVDSGDLPLLQEMKKLPYFKQVTEIKMSLLFKNEQSEIGNLFEKAEKLLIHTQELYPEEITEYSSKI